MGVKTVKTSAIPTAELHKILLTAVAPRPIALASTIDKSGNVNLSPFSFFNVFSANPPILIFSPARRGRDNSTKHTYENILQVREVVVNIVNHAIVEQTSLASTEYDKNVNEFEKAGFTSVPSDSIGPPRVGESPVSFECIVQDVVELGNKGGAGNLMISRIERIHINERYLNAKGNLDTQKLDLVARMGESWYCRANGSSLFEIPKPIFNKGIGVNQLPSHVFRSSILTGNHLGRLGNLENIPHIEALNHLQSSLKIIGILEIDNEEQMIKKLHEYALTYIYRDDLKMALSILFCLNEEST